MFGFCFAGQVGVCSNRRGSANVFQKLRWCWESFFVSANEVANLHIGLVGEQFGVTGCFYCWPFLSPS